MRNYESLFVPGLLQTEAYTRALAIACLPYATDKEVRQRIETRVKRQQSIIRDDPLKLWAIIDEAVLHRQVGGEQVMSDQLAHLLEMIKRPHITLQVLPYRIGAHPGMHGSFALMDFPDAADPALVYVENMAGALYLEKNVDVRRYTEMFDQLRAAALNVADSQHLITEIYGRMGRRRDGERA